MAKKLRLPLPRQVEKTHRDDSQYNRRRAKQVSLEDTPDQPETTDHKEE